MVACFVNHCLRELSKCFGVCRKTRFLNSTTPKKRKKQIPTNPQKNKQQNPWKKTPNFSVNRTEFLANGTILWMIEELLWATSPRSGFFQPFKPKGSETAEPKIGDAAETLQVAESSWKNENGSATKGTRVTKKSENCKRIIWKYDFLMVQTLPKNNGKNGFNPTLEWFRLESFSFHPTRGARYLAGSAPRTRSAWRDLRWIHIGLVILSKALAPQFHCHLNSHNLTMHHCFTPFRNSRSEWPAQDRDLWDAHMSHGKPSWLTFVHAVASNISLANYCNQ